MGTKAKVTPSSSLGIFQSQLPFSAIAGGAALHPTKWIIDICLITDGIINAKAIQLSLHGIFSQILKRPCFYSKPKEHQQVMNRVKMSPSLVLALILALASIASTVTTSIAATTDRNPIVVPTLSQVRGDIATWMQPGQSQHQFLIANASNNPLKDGLGCGCAVCSGMGNTIQI